MAEQDITFGVGLDLSKASDKIKDFAKEVDAIFNGVAKRVSDALTPGNGKGYSGLRAGRPLGIAGTADAAEKAFDELLKKRSASLTDAYLAVAKAQGVNPQAFAKRLFSGIRALEKYNTLPAEAEALAQDMIAHKLDPKTGQGRYGVIQHNLRGFSSVLYALNSMFPALVPKSALEDVEQEKNANLRVGSYYRHWQTYNLNQAERASGVQKTLAYLYGSDRKFTRVANELGLDTDVEGGLDSGFIPEDETIANISNWTSSVRNTMASRLLLSSGNLSKAESKAEIKHLNSEVSNLVRIGKKLGGQLEYNSKQIKRQNDIFVEELRGAGTGGYGISRGVWAALGGKVAKDIFGSVGGMLESYWGESVTRNVYSSRQAYLGRVTTGSKLAGNVIGGLIGAALTPFVGPVAMGAGYVAGGEIGSWFGKYGETKYKSDMISANSMMTRARNKSLYGSAYSTYFAQAMTDQGIANGESAMGGLADKAMSLRARMMLGQVGEQEMLYMSMMPNFFAALMEGKTGPELMRIYQQDLAGIGDPSLRYLVGQAVGNTEAFAAANSPYFSSFYAKNATAAALGEGKVAGLEAGYVFTRGNVAAQNIDKNAYEIMASARRGDETIFSSKYGTYGSRTWQAAQDQAERLGIKTLVNIVQLPDGTEVYREEKSADEVYQQSLSSFYVGG